MKLKQIYYSQRIKKGCKCSEDQTDKETVPAATDFRKTKASDTPSISDGLSIQFIKNSNEMESTTQALGYHIKFTFLFTLLVQNTT